MIGAVLLFALCFNSTGYYFIHLHLKNQVRKEIKGRIKAQVPENELVAIIFTPENADSFHWIHSREFRYNGTMYDIVSSKVLDKNITEYYCITDHQETLLFRNLGKYVNFSMNSNAANSRALNLLSLFLCSLYYENDTSPILYFSSSIIEWKFNTVYYESPFVGLNLPPPEIPVS